jgi:hypothetical protein
LEHAGRDAGAPREAAEVLGFKVRIVSVNSLLEEQAVLPQNLV